MLCGSTFLNFAQQLCQHVEDPLLKDYFLLFVLERIHQSCLAEEAGFFLDSCSSGFFKLNQRKRCFFSIAKMRHIHGRKRAEAANQAQQHEKLAWSCRLSIASRYRQTEKFHVVEEALYPPPCIMALPSPVHGIWSRRPHPPPDWKVELGWRRDRGGSSFSVVTAEGLPSPTCGSHTYGVHT